MTLLADILTAILTLLGNALVARAKTPTLGTEIVATPADVAQTKLAVDYAARFPGVNLLLLVAVLLLCQGCALVERVVYMPQPGVPVRLGQTVVGATVLVKQEDGTYIEATADLYPGMWIIPNTDFTPADGAKAMNLQKAVKP